MNVQYYKPPRLPGISYILLLSSQCFTKYLWYLNLKGQEDLHVFLYVTWQGLDTEEQAGYVSSLLSCLICWWHIMGPCSYFNCTNCWLDAKLEESESTEKRSCCWYPWQLKLFNFFWKGQKQNGRHSEELYSSHTTETSSKPIHFFWMRPQKWRERWGGGLVTEPRGRW